MPPTKVRDLLTKENWIQGNYARDKDGRPVAGDNPLAMCWCLSGAIAKVYGFGGAHIRQRVMKYIHDNGSPHIFPSSFNDSHEWSDIKELIETLDI